MRSILLLLALAGCGGGKGVVLVTVSTTKTLPGVTGMRASVTHGGQKSQPVSLSLNGSFVVGQQQTFWLQFAADRKGAITVAVDVLGAGGLTLLSGSGSGELTPGSSTSITVILGGGEGMADMGMNADMAIVPPDMSILPSWKKVPGPTANDLRGIWITPPVAGAYVVYVAGYGGSLFSAPSEKLRQGSPNPWTAAASTVTSDLFAIWGKSSSDIWAVGRYGTVVHSTDGKSFASTSNQPTNTWDLTSVWGEGGTVYVGGGYGMVFATITAGTMWMDRSQAGGTPIYGIWGPGTGGELYTVGGSGQGTGWINRSSDGGKSWNMAEMNQKQGVDYLNGIWGTSTKNIYAVGNQGKIYHTDDGAAYMNWKEQMSQPSTWISAVWGADATHLVAVGDGIWTTSNGTDWKNASVILPATLNAVAGVSETEIWAVGNGGTVYHYGYFY